MDIAAKDAGLGAQKHGDCVNYELNVTKRHDYVNISFHGELTPENQAAVIEAIFSAVADSGCRNAIIDRREGPLDASALANYEEGKFISDLPDIHRYRIAVILRAEDYDQAPFLESVAIIRGVNWKFFASEEAALEWLVRDVETS